MKHTWKKLDGKEVTLPIKSSKWANSGWGFSATAKVKIKGFRNAWSLLELNMDIEDILDESFSIDVAKSVAVESRGIIARIDENGVISFAKGWGENFEEMTGLGMWHIIRALKGAFELAAFRFGLVVDDLTFEGATDKRDRVFRKLFNREVKKINP